MKRKESTVLIVISFVIKSCLVLPCAKSHYFTAEDKFENNNSKLEVFSTPKCKNYVVTNTNIDAQIFIQSPVFENPNEFYLMKNEVFFGSEAKLYKLEKRDRKFYRTDAYKNVRIKIIDAEGERIIDYKQKNK